jgi:hypothetical protein
MPDEPLYLVWSHERGAWWRTGGIGYTRRLSEAGRMTREQAVAIATKAIPGNAARYEALPELPIRLEDVREMVFRYHEVYRHLDAESWE